MEGAKAFKLFYTFYERKDIKLIGLVQTFDW